MSEEIAARDWFIRARCKIVKEKICRSVDPYTVRTFHVGEELELMQWGRAGRPMRRESWWDSTDIDGAFILPEDCVEVLEVLEERGSEDNEMK